MGEGLVVGIDLGGTKIRTVLADAAGRVVAEVKVPTGAPEGQQAVLRRLIGTVEEVLRLGGASLREVRAVGLGAPGPLDAARGFLYHAPNLGWREVPLKEILEGSLGVPVLVDNDANLAALGEHRFGAGKGVGDMVHVTIGTGIGGGLILGGRLYRGWRDGAGEIGHVTVLPGGPPCRCGNRGCLETVASGTALGGQAREMVARGEGRGILAAAGGRAEAVTAVAVAAAAAGGDPEALALLRRAAGFLGLGVANVVKVLNPALVVLGGGVVEGAPFLVEMVDEAVRAHALSAAHGAVRLERAHLGGKAGVMGAVALASEA
ncbi:MAG: ROK family protein [Firmicutes bacterium]|nr:ROK family protein [Bacillota bacterium]